MIFFRKAPNVDNNRFTDHLGIFFDLCTCENSRGAGYWKLNNALLQNKTFCKKPQAFITKKLKNWKPKIQYVNWNI